MRPICNFSDTPFSDDEEDIEFVDITLTTHFSGNSLYGDSDTLTDAEDFLSSDDDCSELENEKDSSDKELNSNSGSNGNEESTNKNDTVNAIPNDGGNRNIPGNVEDS
ncbi:uncharacterized protein LOC112127460 [Cimex lectularius]|uniref:Uncharacterized protein n=1 Tax=Cimex lectularius TaxID=79782 RepID=A0A8I6TMK4_CIMLE|nr:uncharacterized protein LOC112127460 [Cimex lectularius]